MIITKKTSFKKGGFTLLEVVIAMGLLALLAGMIFGVARTCMQLSNSTIQLRNEANNRTAFFEMMRGHFQRLPGNSEVRLEWEDGGSHYLSNLIFEDVPMAFNWGGRALNSQGVELVTEKRRDGYLDVVMKFYADPIYDETEGRRNEQDPISEITILEDVWRFEWRAFDHRLEEWTNSWEDVQFNPLKMELNVVFTPQGDEMVQVFWITPKRSPEEVIRQQQNSAGNQGNQGNQGNGAQ